jgi:hypothetical protein
MALKTAAPKKAPLWRRRAFVKYIIALFIICLCLWLYLELHYPGKIVATPALLPGNLAAQSVSNLIIQHIDDDATVWGVTGYSVYKSSDGNSFKRAFKVPSGGLVSWLGNLRSIRKISGYVELCEVIPLRSGTILAFAGGYLWRSIDDGSTFQQVHKVNAFGIGRGRGIMPKGLAEDQDGVIYYGEYRRNPQREPVFVYRSLDDGKTWDVVYQFGAGEIRHVHSLSVDPQTNALWVTTGDRDEEAIIAYSVDKGVTFHTVGTGSQQWRTVDLLFTEDSVYWGTDAPSIQNWICRLDRDTLAVERVCKIDGPIYYTASLCDGTLVMGRTVEGGKGELNDMVTIWLSRDGERWINIPLAARKSPRRQAALRLARGNCWPYLLVTPMNTQSFSHALLQMDPSTNYFHGERIQ